jgi:hypothetical protein
LTLTGALAGIEPTTLGFGGQENCYTGVAIFLD